jgi:CSLREA domain-containing protein
MTSRQKATLLAAGFLILLVIFAASRVAAGPRLQEPEFALLVTTTEDHNDGNCNADCSLRDAIIAANKAQFRSTIFLPSGTYTLTLEGSGEDSAETGDLDILSGLTIIGDGQETTIIDAAGLTGQPDRVFDIHADSLAAAYDVGLWGVTITGGHAGTGKGGGIRNEEYARVALDHSSVRANSANEGGGIYTFFGPLQLVDSTVSENSAYDGGGLYIYYATVELDHTSIIGNVATDSGGGIYSYSCPSVHLQRANVSANSAAAQGGGMYIYHSTQTLLHSTISDNHAEQGGGIYVFIGLLTLDHSTVNGNTAESNGGGMVIDYHFDHPAILVDSTITGNSAGTNGGGISTTDSSYLELHSTTVSENSALNGGGVDAGVGETRLHNTIVALNPAGGDCYQDYFVSLGHNLDSDGSCYLDLAKGDLPNTDPRLGPLQDNGGPTLTHALSPQSPALDAGDNSGCPTTDQRGFVRPMDGDGDGTATCDIGAFEHLGLRARFPLVLSNYGPSL